ncbi:MAG: biotin-dependent carboxyltransferase family protein [Verrucomicrobiales bacterium]|nr:biotin-dependent carboxyltransferase family protein [Verrucomicrobiales bacterium]
MSMDVFYVLDPGFGSHLQDRGRSGWRRFGVPVGGVMDQHAAEMANHLMGNSPDAAVLEMCFQGAKLAALRPVWVAVTGADAGGNIQMWRSVQLQTDDVVGFPRSQHGMWTYLAVEGGFTDDLTLDSLGASPRVRLGRVLTRGAILRRSELSSFELPRGVGARSAPLPDRRLYSHPPALRVWPGPQWDCFPDAVRAAFFHNSWKVSSRSDRTGYRLEGQRLRPPPGQLVSEPVRVGTIQVPEDGMPIVTLNDGPTVGGYAKLGVLDSESLSWFVQCRAGQAVRFEPAS